MKPINLTTKGWIVVDKFGSAIGWSFDEMRKGSIEKYAGSIRSWQYWRKRGYRCIKALETWTVVER